MNKHHLLNNEESKIVSSKQLYQLQSNINVAGLTSHDQLDYLKECYSIQVPSVSRERTLYNNPKYYLLCSPHYTSYITKSGRYLQRSSSLAILEDLLQLRQQEIPNITGKCYIGLGKYS
jgi:hypothetical protein